MNAPKWLDDMIELTKRHTAYTVDDLKDPTLETTRALDEYDPGRICWWCYHPRNSPECNFAAGHGSYFEHFVPRDHAAGSYSFQECFPDPDVER